MTANMYEEIVNVPIEEALCLATLIATGEIPRTATIERSNAYFKRIVVCSACPYEFKCLAIIINE